MSSVAIANQIINWKQTEKSASEKKPSSRNSRSPRNIYGSEQKLFTNGIASNNNPVNYQQPVNFGEDGTGPPMFKSQYGQTTREAVKPDGHSYYRQNENINTIKRKKPKTPEQEQTADKPVNGAKTAASDVINEYRQKYMNGSESSNTTNISSRPSSARDSRTMYTRPPPTNSQSNEKDFSFISNDFQSPTSEYPTTTKQTRAANENIVVERGDAIPVDQVLSSYKNTRTYKERPQPEQYHYNHAPSSSVPHMTREQIEKEKQRNEDLNARLRGYAPTTAHYHKQNEHRLSEPSSQPNGVPLDQTLSTNAQAYKDHIYQSLRQYKKDGGKPQPNGNHQMNEYKQTLYTRQVKPMTLDLENDHNQFSFVTEDLRSPAQDVTKHNNNNHSNNSNRKNDHVELYSTVSTQRAEQMAHELNGSPYRDPKKRKPGNKDVLPESSAKEFDINEVLNGYKSKHVYKNNEHSNMQQNHAEITKQKFEDQNQRNDERERLRLDKLNNKLYSDNVGSNFNSSKQQQDYNNGPKADFTNGPTPVYNHNNNGPKADFTNGPTPIYNHNHNNNGPKADFTNGPTPVYNHNNKGPKADFTNGPTPVYNHNNNHPKADFTKVPTPIYNHNNNGPNGPTQEQIFRSREQQESTVMYAENEQKRKNQSFEQTEPTFSYSNQPRPSKTPEPKIGPSKAEMSSNQRFIEHRTRSGTEMHRDDEGWVKMEPAKKVNPGPTTQAREYFHRNRSNSRETIFTSYTEAESSGAQTPHHPFKRTNSSKSNPNVTFGRKDGQEMIAEYQQHFQTEDPYSTRQTENPYSTNPDFGRRQTLPKSKSEPNLFGVDAVDSNANTTELDRLNFANMTSNLRRSKVYRDSPTSQSPVNVYHNNETIIVDNTSRPSRQNSKRSRQTHSNTLSSNHSMQSFGNESTTDERSRTTVMLAKGWSGKVTSTSEGTTKSYDYNLKLDSATGSMNELVFRNKNPIETVKATDTKSDALNSLTSLDRRLRSESGMNRMLFMDSMDWIVSDNLSHDPKTNPRQYRESNYPISEFEALNGKIIQSGSKEGQDMRVTFYESLHKITSLVNQLLESMPKDAFPFKITPCSYQGDFEKRGPHRIDLYLNIEDLKQYQHKVNFLVKKDLAAYILLKSENRQALKQFCARNRDSGDWVLSAGRMMVVFAYVLNTKVRPHFEYHSKTKRKDIKFDAHIEFKVVSENEVRLLIKFPNQPEPVYNVGLSLAFSVDDFPNIIDMNENRQWPDIEGKSKIVNGGTHLMAVPGKVKNHGWGVSFLKTRKILLNHCDGYQTATNILLALQVINKSVLSQRNCSGLLLPVHFIMVLFWVHETYRDKLDWSRENMSQRFIDVLIAMKRCLEKKLCPDFFFPKFNYFESLNEEELYRLLQNLNDVLAKPDDYLKQ